METDPVCGMSVELPASFRSEYMGADYAFCCRACKDAFDLDPERYAGVAAEFGGGD